ncbi:hypothetical protein GCM10010277_64450 [Streptomyces longisporoflavus]|uniref:hypothetical protein n=1 Tax=Streptomyces longisporoflavus TaxID=28044 RepID=UPI00167C8937|nr:hypothetical protein [Streptomyces longisporoflavus]GGV60259.1 hypothetical protein GCM10010277_64450 [Streptomyces longisporoflavus]
MSENEDYESCEDNDQNRKRPPLLGTEMREATLPDGSQAVIVVQAGTSQAEVDEKASRLHRATPEPK